MIENILEELHEKNVQSVIVEGEAKHYNLLLKKICGMKPEFLLQTRLEGGVKSPEIEGEIIAEEKIMAIY